VKAATLANPLGGINAGSSEEAEGVHRPAGDGGDQLRGDRRRLAQDGRVGAGGGLGERAPREPCQLAGGGSRDRPDWLIHAHAPAADEPAALEGEVTRVFALGGAAAGAAAVERRCIAARREEVQLEGAQHGSAGAPASSRVSASSPRR